MDSMDERPETHYLRRLTALEQERDAFEDEWEDITRLILPRRNGWEKTTETDKRPSTDIYDGTAIAALTLMCDGLLGHLIPASMPFFRFVPSIKALDDFKPLRLWLDKAQEHITAVLNRSNFHSALGEIFPDAGALGTGVMYVEEDLERARVVFSVRHLKEMFIAENRWGEVDTVYRQFMITLGNLVETFGDSLDQKILDRAEKNPDEKVELLHAVEKNKGTGRAFSSVYVLLEGDRNKSRVLDEGGYDWMPYVVWRFRKNSDEAYGRSPAMDALYDVEMINHQAKSMAEAAHKAINPPLLAHESMRGKIKKNPDSITYWDGMAPGGNQVSSLYGGALGAYPLGIDAMERRAKIIREHFRSDFFSYLLAEGAGQRDRTATEVNAIEAQKAAVLGATIGRVTKELLEPVILDVFNIEREAGRLPPLPRELAQIAQRRELHFEVEYTGPLAQKQKQYLRSQGIMDGIAAISGIVQATGRGEVFDQFNFDMASQKAAMANGLPEEMILDGRVVQKMRQARAQQQAELQQAAMDIEAAKVAPGLTKAPEPGSPAEEMNGSTRR